MVDQLIWAVLERYILCPYLGISCKHEDKGYSRQLFIGKGKERTKICMRNKMDCIGGAMLHILCRNVDEY